MGDAAVELSWQQILDRAAVPTVLASPDDRILWANSAATTLIGATLGELLGRHFATVLHADEKAALAADSTHLLRVPAEVSERDVRWDHGGRAEARWLTIRTSFVPAAPGSQACLVHQLTDTTAEKKAEAALADAHQLLRARNLELERSNEELTEFAYIASHDLSEPLRVIAGHVELLARRYSGQLDDDADRYIAFAVDGCTRMRTLIGDLLRYSRAGREVDLSDVDVQDVVDQVLRDLAPALTEAGGTVTVRGELGSLRTDRSQFSQLLSNLIANAVKYAGEGQPPQVELSVEQSAGSWRLTVDDNGPGIPKAQYQRVFRIFQRLHGREIPGTGIGLAICRRIVERQGGTIEIAESPAGGASFTISFPRSVTLA